jgi:hypothetical protein
MRSRLTRIVNFGILRRTATFVGGAVRVHQQSTPARRAGLRGRRRILVACKVREVLLQYFHDRGGRTASGQRRLLKFNESSTHRREQ